ARLHAPHPLAPSPRGGGVLGREDGAFGHLDGDALERVAVAGAAGALAVVESEAGAVGAADQVAAFLHENAPVGALLGIAGVRALVAEGGDGAAAAGEDERVAPAAVLDVDDNGAGIGKRVQAREMEAARQRTQAPSALNGRDSSAAMASSMPMRSATM